MARSRKRSTRQVFYLGEDDAIELELTFRPALVKQLRSAARKAECTEVEVLAEYLNGITRITGLAGAVKRLRDKDILFG